MTELRHFTAADAPILQKSLYPDMPLDELVQMINDWNTLVFSGRYFEMFAIDPGPSAVGTASLYEHSKSVVSFGIEVFEGERKKGFAYQAASLLLERARSKGFRIVLDQVGADNAASIRLHEKLRFESDGYVYQNKKGNDVVLFLKAL